MAKKINSKEAVKAAQRYLSIKTAVKGLDQEAKECLELVRCYVKDTGELRLGDAQVFEKRTAPKLEIDPKKLNGFLRALPAEYIKKSADAKSILENISDEKVKKALEKFDACISQSSEFQVKYF
jgi:hypothetical protein